MIVTLSARHTVLVDGRAPQTQVRDIPAAQTVGDRNHPQSGIRRTATQQGAVSEADWGWSTSVTAL